MKILKLLSWLTMGLFIAAAIGCKDGRPDRVPVSGQVLFDGKPLTFGHIRFVPKGARQASGSLDSNGRFTLSCFAENDGVVLGTHPVEIIVSEPVSEKQVRWHAPAKYASISTSGLTEEIKDPANNVTINLKSDGKKYPYVETID